MKKLSALILVFAMLALTVPAQGAPELDRLSREDIINTLIKVNEYWIEQNPYPGDYVWNRAVYFTGNMELYYLTGIEKYKEYSEFWAELNKWTGNRAPESDGAFFADDEACFQTYIDLYNIENDPKKIKIAKAVIDRQINTSKLDYWWWIDALYMAEPVFVKLYLLTGDIKYLDAMDKYYTYTKSKFQDPEEKLWYRDANYVYPKRQTVSGKKLFWSRGNGWVFAAHAKVLSDLPDDYRGRSTYVQAFREMADALVRCQQPEGYWTRSLLDPADAPGPETSGTAFFAYGLAWGINSGILERDKYLPALLKAWDYLSNTAVQSSGKLGYVQPIGADPAPGVTVDRESTQDFGVGAFLLAGCEMSKLVGDMEGDILPYLQKKMLNAVALKVGTPYANARNKISFVDPENDKVVPIIKGGRTLVPVRFIAESFGAEVGWDDATKTVTVKSGEREIKLVLGESEYTINGRTLALDVPAQSIEGRTMIPLRAMAEALGKKVFWDGENSLIVISHQENRFLKSCEKGLIKMLSSSLDAGKYPERAPQEPSNFSIPKLEGDPLEVKAVAVTASAVPQPENGKENVLDRDYMTRWSAEGDQWIMLDLGESVKINKVGISFFRGDERANKFQIQVSNDGVNWTDVFNGESSGKTVFVEYYTFEPVNARYVRYYGHGNSNGSMWNSPTEIIVFRSE